MARLYLENQTPQGTKIDLMFRFTCITLPNASHSFLAAFKGIKSNCHDQLLYGSICFILYRQYAGYYTIFDSFHSTIMIYLILFIYFMLVNIINVNMLISKKLLRNITCLFINYLEYLFIYLIYLLYKF